MLAHDKWQKSFNSLMAVAGSYRNQSIDLQSKWMDWFLYDNGLRHERVKHVNLTVQEII